MHKTSLNRSLHVELQRSPSKAKGSPCDGGKIDCNVEIKPGNVWKYDEICNVATFYKILKNDELYPENCWPQDCR